jgi:hypothetical protein
VSLIMSCFSATRVLSYLIPYVCVLFTWVWVVQVDQLKPYSLYRVRSLLQALWFRVCEIERESACMSPGLSVCHAQIAMIQVWPYLVDCSSGAHGTGWRGLEERWTWDGTPTVDRTVSSTCKHVCIGSFGI